MTLNNDDGETERLTEEMEKALAHEVASVPSAAFIPDRPKPPSADRIALEAALRDKEAFADAHFLVARAIARGNRDAAAPLAADSDAIRAIHAILVTVHSQI